jgi:hypothetical protein
LALVLLYDLLSKLIYLKTFIKGNQMEIKYIKYKAKMTLLRALRKLTINNKQTQSKAIKQINVPGKFLFCRSFVVLIVLTGCVNTPKKISVSDGMRPTLVNYSPPEWVLKGPGTFKDPTGKIIWGVSSVSGVKNSSLQRIAADNRARNAVAKVFQVHSKSLSKDMLAHAMTGNLESTSEEQGIETGIKTVVEQILHGVMIVDHWEHPGRNELFSLARLDLNQFKNITNKSFEGKANGKSKDNTNNAHQEYFNKTSKFPEEIKESIKNSSDKFFQELN